jgi:hypothetical protein
MEGILSTAIGLSGTPKDYTGLQAARERQRGIEQQRKQLARDKELDELRKGLVVKDGFYLPGRYEDVERYTAEAVDNMVKALESGDRRELAQLQSKYFNTMNGWNEERKQVDELKKKVQSGEVFLGTDINDFYLQDAKAFKSRMQELHELKEVSFSTANPNLPIMVQAYKSYDKPKFLKGIEDSLPRNQFREETFMVNGKQVVQQVFSGNEEDLRYTLADYFESNPNIKKGEFLALKRLNPNATDEQILQEAKRRWVDDGVMFMKEKRRNLGGGGITVNTGDNTSVPSNIELNQEDVLYTPKITDYNTFAFAKELAKKYNIKLPTPNEEGGITLTTPAFTTSQATYKASSLAGTGVRDVFTGEKLNKADVINQSYNQTVILPVFNNPDSPNDDGIAIPSIFMNDPRVLKELKDKGKIRYEIVSIGNQGRSVAYNSIKGSGFMGESEKDKGLLNSLDTVLKNKLKELNDGLKSGKTTPSNQQPTQVQPKQTQQKQPANATSGNTVDKWKQYKLQGNIK